MFFFVYIFENSFIFSKTKITRKVEKHVWFSFFFVLKNTENTKFIEYK